MSGFEDVNYYFRKAARVMDLSAAVGRILVMRDADAALARVVGERKVSFRTAAFVMAIGRVGRATVLRGV